MNKDNISAILLKISCNLIILSAIFHKCDTDSEFHCATINIVYSIRHCISHSRQNALFGLTFLGNGQYCYDRTQYHRCCPIFSPQNILPRFVNTVQFLIHENRHTCKSSQWIGQYSKVCNKRTGWQIFQKE